MSEEFTVQARGPEFKRLTLEKVGHGCVWLETGNWEREIGGF